MRNRITSILAIPTAILLVLILSSCRDSDPSEKPAKSAAPTSLNGVWKGDIFEATVADNSIEMTIVDGESKSLYWKGTFPAGTGDIKSVADAEALDSSLMGSSEPEKVFKVSSDEIVFDFTMLGTTKTIHLKKA